MSDPRSDFLVILIDLNLISPEFNALKEAKTFLSQILAFCNSYSLCSLKNQLAVFAVDSECSHLLYLKLGDYGNDPSVFPSTGINQKLVELLSRVANVESDDIPDSSTSSDLSSSSSTTSGPAPPPHLPTPSIPLSGALSRALCLIHRRRLMAVGGSSGSGGSGSYGGSGVNSGGDNTSTSSGKGHFANLSGSTTLSGMDSGFAAGRILVLTSTPDAPAQYIPVMNAAISAQRSDVAINAFFLAPASEPDSLFLQQATHLTGGVYRRLWSNAALLQELSNYMLCDWPTRNLLEIPQGAGIDFRASCFCHKRPIEISFVCSVCLSIFCQPSKVCSTCGSKFQSLAGRNVRKRVLTGL